MHPYPSNQAYQRQQLPQQMHTFHPSYPQPNYTQSYPPQMFSSYPYQAMTRQEGYFQSQFAYQRPAGFMERPSQVQGTNNIPSVIQMKEDTSTWRKNLKDSSESGNSSGNTQGAKQKVRRLTNEEGNSSSSQSDFMKISEPSGLKRENGDEIEKEDELIKNLLKHYYISSKENNSIERLLTQDLKLSWKKIGTHSLSIIAKKFGSNFIQKYFNSLSSKELFKNKPFSVDEDQLIMDSIEKFGRDWKQIASQFPQRGLTVLKNRYYYLTKKGIVDKITNTWVHGKGDYEGIKANQESQQGEAISNTSEKRPNPYVEEDIEEVEIKTKKIKENEDEIK